jgi:hypothetical protein
MAMTKTMTMAMTMMMTMTMTVTTGMILDKRGERQWYDLGG